MNTILLTGFPRSGTTLLCVLLHSLENSVALAEPIFPITKLVSEMPEAVKRFEHRVRRQVLTEGTVPTKAVGGKLVDNVVESAGGDNLRANRDRFTTIRVDKPLTEDFLLYIKHPAWFTAAAEQLQAHYPLFAIVRDPLAVLASWQTVEMPVHNGHMPSAEQLLPSLRARLARIPEALERQIELIRWILGVYAKLPAERVIRYEDMISTPEATLAHLHPAPGRIDHPLRNQSIASRYPQVDFERLARALEPLTPLIRGFYPDWEAEEALLKSRSQAVEEPAQ